MLVWNLRCIKSSFVQGTGGRWCSALHADEGFVVFDLDDGVVVSGGAASLLVDLDEDSLVVVVDAVVVRNLIDHFLHGCDFIHVGEGHHDLDESGKGRSVLEDEGHNEGIVLELNGLVVDVLLDGGVFVGPFEEPSLSGDEICLRVSTLGLLDNNLLDGGHLL